MSKIYRVSVVASSTVRFQIRVKAETEQGAKDALVGLLRNWHGVPMKDQPGIEVIEPPIDPHDYHLEDVEAEIEEEEKNYES